MQVPRETSYEDLQKLILKEMAPILHDDILTSSQPSGVRLTCFISMYNNSLYYFFIRCLKFESQIQHVITMSHRVT